MNTYHLTKIKKWKVYAVRFAAALLMFIFGILLGLTAKGQETRQQSNFYAITGNGLKDTS